MERSQNIKLKFDYDQKQKFPADALINALKGFQIVIHLLAMNKEKKEIRQRSRIPSDIEQKYILYCEKPEKGSYVMPVSIGNPDVDLFPETIKEVSDQFQKTCCAFAEGSFEKIEKLLPDFQYRKRIIEAYKTALPKAGSGIKLKICNDVDSYELGDTVHKFIKSLLCRKEKEEEVVKTITGQLLKIDFSERKVTILYPVNNRALECTYDEEIEEFLFDNRRRTIQVTGKVILDNTDMPTQIFDVEKIQDLDLTPFHISEFSFGNLSLRSKNQITFLPELDESKQLICIRNEKFDIDVCAYTRAELLDELNEQIIMLWQEYVLEKDENLSPPALKLKKLLSEEFEESK